MYKNILVAVDGSAACERALAEGADLARKYHGCIRVIHVVARPTTPSDQDIAKSSQNGLVQSQAGEQIISDALARVKNGGRCADAVLAQAARQSVAQIIIEHSKQWPADVVVVGTHPANERRTGSITRELIVRGTIPVLCVKAAKRTTRRYG